MNRIELVCELRKIRDDGPAVRPIGKIVCIPHGEQGSQIVDIEWSVSGSDRASGWIKGWIRGRGVWALIREVIDSMFAPNDDAIRSLQGRRTTDDP
mgnify:CR=1 FL=1